MESVGQITGDDLAYMLYTSGSTGQPKGVMLSHKAALAFVDWSYRTFSVKPHDVISSHAPLHFDLSVFDIFVSIKAGAKICLVPQGLSSFPKSVVEFINNNKISIWYSVPSILTQLILYGNLEEQKFSSLKQILFAGEVFPSKYLRSIMELIPHAKYYNLYGPTETNVITYYQVTEPPETDKAIPIGKLCDGVASFIVNESGTLVREGEQGELYVTCPTLMEGYWNDAQKTESVLSKNIHDPSSDKTLYKTGDLVSWNSNGYLNYHGRCDAMIKSRGYRIELGEVETALLSHTGIKEAAVTAVPDDKIGNIIKAVVVAKNKDEITENEVKRFCSKKIPHYMIPEIITIVDSLPRTSTGKIDRKKLVEYSE
jgi:amino acid adenylation domain-containing protein